MELSPARFRWGFPFSLLLDSGQGICRSGGMEGQQKWEGGGSLARLHLLLCSGSQGAWKRGARGAREGGPEARGARGGGGGGATLIQ